MTDPVGRADLVIAWNPAVVSEERYARLVTLLGDLVRAEGGLGIERIRSAPMRLSIGDKGISADRLIEILKALPDGSFILANQVGNLTVTDSTGYEYRGFIDLLSDRYEDVTADSTPADENEGS